MASTVDSLIAIKTAVFDQKMLKLSEFSRALKQNFRGYDSLRQFVLHHCEKYGNDLEIPDQVMRILADLFCDEVNQTDNQRGGRFQTGMYTYVTHGVMGRLTGALPDGRPSRTALSNSLCAVQGADKNGPTAAMCSVTKLDLTKLGNNMVFDVKFNPSFFKRLIESGKFRPFVQGYFNMGGGEIQVNSVDRETLLDAQKHPEQYANLIVRVSGFSAYFVLLDKVIQDEIILRTEVND